MPTYEYECPKHGVFEEFHSISTKLEYCPECEKAGETVEVKRLISLGSRGVVELTGQDLIDKIKSDTKQLKKDASKSEKVYANMLGEDRYQQLQTKMDQRKRDRR